MSTNPDERPEPLTDERKTIEKNGYPEPAPRAAADDLRFVVRESLKLGMKVLSELDRVLRVLTR